MPLIDTTSWTRRPGCAVHLGYRHDQVHCFGDQIAHGRVAGLLDQLLNPGQARAGGVDMGICVDGADPAGMPGVPGFQEREGGTIADLADDDPVRAQTHCGFQQPQYAHEICCSQDHFVVGSTLKFSRVLDNDEAMRGIDFGHVIQDRIRQCRLPRACATDNKDVLPITNGTLDRGALRCPS